ncbi:polyprotein [Biomphalaria glabrata]|nr:Retrovirus-related Pol polyprotein from transposon 297; partial [Biomphalaria glabrata]
MGKPDTFNEGTETFINYKERLDAYFIANSTPSEKKAAILLASIGAKPYATLRSLASPELPITKSYVELCKLLNNHYSHPPLEILEKIKFHNRIQEDSETNNELITAIKALSEYCNFGPALQESLKDRFVCGLKDVNIQKRLLQEANLTLLTAINIATAM